MHVDIVPDAGQLLLEGAFRLQMIGRPGAAVHGMLEPAPDEGDGAATMADADIEAGVAVEHAAEQQGGNRGGFLRGEAGHDVELVALEGGGPGRAIDAFGGGVQEQRDIEFDEGFVEGVHRRVVQPVRHAGADTGGVGAEIAHGTAELDDGGGDVLHRERGGGPQPAGVAGNQGRQPVIVAAAEGDCVFGRDIVEVGQRVGGKELPVDPRTVHGGEADIHIHEGAAAVADAAQAVVADAEDGDAAFVVCQFGPEGACRAEGFFQHGMGVNVDDGGALEGHGIPAWGERRPSLTAGRALVKHRFRYIEKACR